MQTPWTVTLLLVLAFVSRPVTGFLNGFLRRVPRQRDITQRVTLAPNRAEAVRQMIETRSRNLQSRYIPRVKAEKESKRAVVKKDEWLSSEQLNREMLPYMAALFLGGSVSVLFGALEPLETLFGAEAFFFAYCSLLKENWLKHPVPVSHWPHDSPWSETWKSVLESVPDAKSWFTSWFLGPSASWDRITREDAVEFLSWAMFVSTPSALVGTEEEAEVSRAVDQIEEFTKHNFPARKKGAVPLRSMRATIEPLRSVHKPLLFYVFTQGLFGLGLGMEMKNLGFQEYAEGDFRYFLFRNTQLSSVAADPPIVFYHGVGGLAAYLPLVKALSSMGRDVVCFEMPYVSLHVAPNVPSIPAHVDAFRAVMDRHFPVREGGGGGGTSAVLIGHSWGSNVCSWICKSLGSERVASAVFLDPVCFMLHLRDITHAWFYKDDTAKLFKEDEQSRDPSSVMAKGREIHDDRRPPPLMSMRALVTLVKTELFVVNALQRPLIWHRNQIWCRDLQAMGIPSLVVVSSSDHIVPHAAVLEHVTDHERECAERGETSIVRAKCLDGADHGGLVFEERFRSYAVELIAQTVQISKAQGASHLASVDAGLGLTGAGVNVSIGVGA